MQSNAGMNVMGIVATAAAAIYACEALNVFSPAAVQVAKTTVGIASGVAIASFILSSTIEAVEDMMENHKNPSQDYWNERQKSKKNSYSKIDGTRVNIESYLLEDFLYEKPFVNLAVHNENDWTESIDSTKMDSLGLYGKNGSLAVKPMEAIRNAPPPLPFLLRLVKDGREGGPLGARGRPFTGRESCPEIRVGMENLVDLLINYTF